MLPVDKSKTCYISSNSQPRPCGCGSGDSGCSECGVCRNCAGEMGPDQDRLHEGANGRILEMLARTKEMIPLDILFCKL